MIVPLKIASESIRNEKRYVFIHSDPAVSSRHAPDLQRRLTHGLRRSVNHERSTETYRLDSTPLTPVPSKPRARVTINPTTP
jgi:hypothetical protein